MEKHANTPSKSCRDSSHSKKGPGHASCWNVTPHTAGVRTRTHTNTFYTVWIESRYVPKSIFYSKFKIASCKAIAFKHSVHKYTCMCTYSRTWLTALNMSTICTLAIIIIGDIHIIQRVRLCLSVIQWLVGGQRPPRVMQVAHSAAARHCRGPQPLPHPLSPAQLRWRLEWEAHNSQSSWGFDSTYRTSITPDLDSRLSFTTHPDFSTANVLKSPRSDSRPGQTSSEHDT